MSVIDATLRLSQCRFVFTHDEILRELRDQVGQKRFSQKALADHLGIAPPRVKEMLKGERRIQPSEMPLVADWLGMADGDRAIRLPEGAEPVVAVPLLGEVPAGPVRAAIRNPSGYVYVSKREAPKDSYALRVSGESMNVHAPNGCTIVVDPNDTALFPGRRFVVRTTDGEATFKEYAEGPARLVAVSTYDGYPDIILGSEPLEILGRVVSVTTRL